MSTIWTFDGIEINPDVYSSKDCIKRFFESLREHIMKLINFAKKKMIPLINEEYESYLNQKKLSIL